MTIPLVIVRLAAVGVIGSTFLPWYSALSGRALCARLILPYVDVEQQDPMLLTRPCRLEDGQLIDLWVFRERGAMVVAVGVLALLVASQARHWPFAVLPLVAICTVGWILADQPGFGDEARDLYSVRWGGWVGLVFAAVIAAGSALVLVRDRTAARDGP